MRNCVAFSFNYSPRTKKGKQSGTKFLNRNSWKLCCLFCKKPVNGPTTIVFKCKHKVRNSSNWEIVFYFFWTKKKKTECYYFTASTFNVYVQVSKNIMSPFTFTARRLIVSWHVQNYISQVLTINTWVILWHTKMRLVCVSLFWPQQL